MSHSHWSVRRLAEGRLCCGSRRGRDTRGDLPRPGRACEYRRRDHGLRAPGRRRDERGAAGRAQGRSSERSAVRDGESCVRLRASGCCSCGRGDANGLHRSRGCWWHRVDVGRTVLPERRSLGLSHGSRGSVRLGSRRRAHVCDRGLSHGRHRREHRRTVWHFARRPGRVRR